MLFDGEQNIIGTDETRLPFDEAAETTVTANGTLTAELDTSSGTVGQEFSATFQSGSRAIGSVDGQLVGALATVEIAEPPVVGRQLNAITVEAALPRGGFVAIHDQRFLDGDRAGSIRGLSEYRGPSLPEHIEVPLTEPYLQNGTAIAVLYRDPATGSQFDPTSDTQTPYLADKMPVTDTAAITVRQPPTIGKDESGETDADLAPTPEISPPQNSAAGTNNRSVRTPPSPNASLRRPSQPPNASSKRPAQSPNASEAASSISNNATMPTATNGTSPQSTNTQPGLGVLSALLGICVAMISRKYIISNTYY